MAAWTTDYIPGPPRIAVDHAGSGPLVILSDAWNRRQSHKLA
jgi:hypothetical protein